MIDSVTGDPGSCSQLGGVLRSHAARLQPLRAELAERTADLRRGRADVGSGLVGDLEAGLALLDTVVDRLDAAGATLQRYAQEMAELGEGIRRLEQAAASSGVELDGLRVIEPWGVLTTELAERRHRTQPELQRRADRLASVLGRTRGVTVRALAEATQALAEAARLARLHALS
jgi:hypothetical protein